MLLAELQTLDLYDLQERYVDLFDKTRRHSLHLFEHIHGESRDRGQAMVDLVAHYERGGLDVTANELPDYLPLFLEFLSTRPITRRAASSPRRPTSWHFSKNGSGSEVRLMQRFSWPSFDRCGEGQPLEP